MEKANVMGSKYGNMKTQIDGITFASKHEASRYCELKYLERAGLIKNLHLQEKFELIPATKKPNGKMQRPIYYVADFVYSQQTVNGWRRIVEDAKGCRTAVYRLKKKMMIWRYGIEIKEV